jgi:hypothetical protein
VSSAHRAQQLAKHTHNLSVTHNMSDCHAIKYELTFSKYELTLIFFPLSNFKIQKIQYKVCGLVVSTTKNQMAMARKRIIVKTNPHIRR